MQRMSPMRILRAIRRQEGKCIDCGVKSESYRCPICNRKNQDAKKQVKERKRKI